MTILIESAGRLNVKILFIWELIHKRGEYSLQHMTFDASLGDLVFIKLRYATSLMHKFC